MYETFHDIYFVRFFGFWSTGDVELSVAISHCQWMGFSVFLQLLVNPFDCL
jgi:hypothetical protein